MPRFRMGTLDHVHVMVPDRAVAAAWYAEHLGFEPVEEYDMWATEVEFGPLQISADGGRSMLALFEIGEGHPERAQENGIAFSVDASTFADFARSLPNAIVDPSGRALTADDVVDFDLCWAYNLADPWGNVYELNCYQYDLVRTSLIEPDGISPVRYWPKTTGG
ncbi:MAG: VOC family protein [Acidimicrobiales bacterium]